MTNEVLLFNILTGLTTVVLALCLLWIKRLKCYMVSPAWSWMTISLALTTIAQLLSVANIYLYGGGLNRLGLVNTVVRSVGVGCFFVSLVKMRRMFAAMYERLDS